MSIERFSVRISEDILADLGSRIGGTRWPDQIAGSGWDYGTDTDYLRELLDYWQKGFDWRVQEARINGFDHWRADVGGLKIHFIRAKARTKRTIPLLLLHGWPSSFLQMLDIIPLLSDPGDDDALSFEVIAPSLPGYGFSDIPVDRGMGEKRMADLFLRLMRDVLGHQRFAARGSDIGGGVLRHLAAASPAALIGLHLTGQRPVVTDVPADMTADEHRFVADAQRWMATERGYALLHSTRPQTLAHGLSDSPAGLAAWIVEKFRAWSDCGGDVERRFSKDALLANLTLYWVTGTINSSMRVYFESLHDPLPGGIDVPTAMMMARHDIVFPPREWVERSVNVARWTEIDRGGHFLEWEEPAAVAEDIRSFFTLLEQN